MIYYIWKKATITSWKHAYQLWLANYRQPSIKIERDELNSVENPIQDYTNDPDPEIEDPFTQPERIGSGRNDNHPEQPPPSKPPNTNQKERQRQDDSRDNSQQRWEERMEEDRNQQDPTDWHDKDYGNYWGNQ